MPTTIVNGQTYRGQAWQDQFVDLVMMDNNGNLLQHGFFVDVGAHHPQRFSNTYYFYLKGWSGINIDAMPGSMKIFDDLRSRDINLEIPISDKSEILTYYEFDEPALNSFSLSLSHERITTTNY